MRSSSVCSGREFNSSFICMEFFLPVVQNRQQDQWQSRCSSVGFLSARPIKRRRFLEESWSNLRSGQGGRFFALECERSSKVVEFLVGPLTLNKGVCQQGHFLCVSTVSKQGSRYCQRLSHLDNVITYMMGMFLTFKLVSPSRLLVSM